MLESTRFSSNFRNGNSTGTDPVAIITFFARYDSVFPSAPATSTTFPFLSVPRPFAQVILFFLKRNSIPFVFCPTTVSLRFIIVDRSSFRSPIVTPCSAACSRANS